MKENIAEKAIKIGSILFFGIIVFIYVIQLKPVTRTYSQNLSIMILYLILIISLFNLYLCISRSLLFQGITWSFWVVFLCIAPLVQIKTNRFPLYADVSPKNSQTSVNLILLATVALWFSTLSKKNLQTNRVKNLRFDTSSDRFIIILTAINLVTFFIIVMRSSIKVYLLTRYEFESAIKLALFNQQIGLLVTVICESSALICASYFLLNRNHVSFRSANGFMRLLIIAEAIYVNNPISSSRLGFVAMLIVIALSMGRIKRSLVQYFLLSIVPFYLFIFPILDRFRYRNVRIKKVGFFDSFLNPDFDSFQQFSNTVAFVQERGFQMGKQIIGAFLLFIPNELWQSKPTPSGPLVATTTNLRFTNISSPIPAEAYIDFGIIGVFCYSIIIGYLLSRADAYIITAEGNAEFRSIPVVLLIAFSGQVALLLRGSLIGVAGTSILMFLYYCLYRLLSSNLKPSS
jgi:oligosaccharide repeat unit polymerase